MGYWNLIFLGNQLDPSSYLVKQQELGIVLLDDP